ncbi:MAG: hypothetical protein H7122_02555 [Chitinophagaceae bacterium]|nr:hypothetical protein [Chitinophagaceae bacterium]
MIQKYLEDYAVYWRNSEPRFPLLNRKFNFSDKQARERVLDQYLESVKTLRKKKQSGHTFSAKDERHFLDRTRNFLCHTLDFTTDQLDVMLSPETTEVCRQFATQARQFDPTIDFKDILQAGRNVWIMNGLQIVLGLPVKLTPSIFAYSLLYPYTDNLIDNPEITSFDKMIFSNNFHKRLEGKPIKPNNPSEEIIYSLVAMIEEEFPRADYPGVYQSLLAIHETQTNSVQLMLPEGTLSETETLKICLAKGGASVIADGYLVAGTLTKEQEFFLFGYGAYLQLLDDIQDVKEDGDAGLKTLFSKNHELLEMKINQTWWFGDQVMQGLSLLGGQHLEVFGSLMQKSMDLFIIEAIAQNPDLYSLKYIHEMEAHSPFSFSYIQKQKSQFAPYHGFLLTAMDEVVFDTCVPEKEVVMAAG